MTIDRKTLVLFVACFIAGWWFASSPPSQPGPLGPLSPQRDRPVARWIARTAKSMLVWFIFAEQPPQPEAKLAHHNEIGADGYPKLDHARAF